MMENKEAIEYLLYMKHDVQAGSPVDVAIDTAIEALKATVKQPKTNGDRIRAMTDEELAEWLDEIGNCRCCADIPTRCHMECCYGHMEWLKQEVNANAKAD